MINDQSFIIVNCFCWQFCTQNTVVSLNECQGGFDGNGYAARFLLMHTALNRWRMKYHIDITIVVVHRFSLSPLLSRFSKITVISIVIKTKFLLLMFLLLGCHQFEFVVIVILVSLMMMMIVTFNDSRMMMMIVTFSDNSSDDDDDNDI